MWIQFKSSRTYAIKIYVGGINAVSGEPEVETAATRLRRRNLLSRGKSIQDYVVTPDQMWLDGIATEPGTVRQFVSVPMGSGHSVEAQVTGEETTGGIQFEIAKLVDLSLGVSIEDPSSEFILHVKTLTSKTFSITVESQTTIKQVKEEISLMENIPADQQRIILAGEQPRGLSIDLLRGRSYSDCDQTMIEPSVTMESKV